jgi:hypothetical protein
MRLDEIRNAGFWISFMPANSSGAREVQNRCTRRRGVIRRLWVFEIPPWQAPAEC